MQVGTRVYAIEEEPRRKRTREDCLLSALPQPSCFGSALAVLRCVCLYDDAIRFQSGLSLYVALRAWRTRVESSSLCQSVVYT